MVAPEPSMARLLTNAQRHRYKHDGVLFPIAVLTPEETRRFRRASDLLEKQLGGRPRTIEVRQMHLHFPWAYQLATHPRILDAVSGVLGESLLVWATELFAKPPRDSAVSIGWHRDWPYMGFDAAHCVTAWVALSASTLTNGCMRVVPDAKRRRFRGKQSRAAVIDETRVQDVLLKPGEMSLHDSDILHGSNPNRSRSKRVGFVIRYITPEAKPRQEQPPVILARGRDGIGNFRIVGPPNGTDNTKSLAPLQRSARQHFEMMLASLKG
jgi:ectoine hydroxylase-related dioxygenase (phytanoyl-CoA dioxygenase family)